MAEVLKNTNAPVYHQIFWAGEVVDADNLPMVEIFDISYDVLTDNPDPEYRLDEMQAYKDETNIGLYYITIPVQHTINNSTLRLKWTYEINGVDVVYGHDVFITTPYVDLYEASGDLGVSTDPSDPQYKSYKELVAAERYARKRIEAYTGQKFYPYNTSITLYGTDSDVLPLPEYISEIHKVYIDDVLVVDNTSTPAINNLPYALRISETGFGIRLDRQALVDNTVYTANGLVPPSIHDASGVFRDKSRYTVSGLYGYKKIPDDIDLAAIELMKDFFSKDMLWKNQYIKNIQTFDWQFEYNSDIYKGTGNSYVDTLLSDYVLDKIAII